MALPTQLKERIPSYLESLQIDQESGRNIAELFNEERWAFWRRTHGHALVEFIKGLSQ